jgi:hypothetical protein
MKPPILRLALTLTLLASCGQSAKNGTKTGPTDVGGEGGGDETGGTTGGAGGAKGGSGGSKASGGSGGSLSAPDAAAEGGSGGTTAVPDASATGGSGGGDETPDASPPATGDGGGAMPAGAIAWYECEAVPPNTIFGATTIVTCSAGPCPSHDAIKEGIECCSGGKKLSQLLRGKGGAVLNAIAAPSDGMYDVTWWFHCGKDDNFGDTGCGGAPHTKSGCRPHVLEVNGTKLPKVYHFPCFPGSWGELHASTTTIPLKGGMNSIRVYATPGRDAADLDAIELFPAGKGLPPNIAGTAN